MARNSAGTYSLPAGTPHVAGTIISAATANTVEGDIAQALTDSLDRNGKGGMLAPMRTVDGTVTAPAHSFTSETGSGWFRHAAGELRAAILGTYRFALTAAGAIINGTLNVGSTITASGRIEANTAVRILDGTSGKFQALIPFPNLAQDQTITFPTALPGSTLPVTMTSAGVLSTGQLVNAQQNFGTPSATTDVAIKSYVDGLAAGGGGLVAGATNWGNTVALDVIGPYRILTRRASCTNNAAIDGDPVLTLGVGNRPPTDVTCPAIFETGGVFTSVRVKITASTGVMTVHLGADPQSGDSIHIGTIWYVGT